ncbi:Purine catabolism regulatory protein [Pelotomaculum sp. FP]|uniref:PucR family transcriptional regulator n=1 Tax=Pelotomaculum sp. FP TaxID=261474 RepID=UPI0010658F6D|nr:PucR family transcriptional regulator [Pelotomaculum sp. FP]TEB16428.1 Purine catabolism regulatory protein [Pelotomaculum sp. FP]
MPFTVHELLKLPLLSGAHLIAGKQGTKKLIKSISFMEAPDSVNWVMPHDFLITNTYLFRSNPGLELNIISKLAKKEVSAIGIKLHRYMNNIPEIMKWQSDEEGLPIIILPYNVTPSQLISTITKTLNSHKSSQKEVLENPHISFICELLFSTNFSDTTLLRKASTLGWNFTKSYGVIVIRLNKINFIKQVVSIIQNSNNIYYSYVFQYEKEIIILYEIDASMETQSQFTKYGKDIKARCEKEYPDLKILIGIGRAYNNILDLRKSHNEAVQSLNFGPLLVQTNSVIHFDTLGIFKILCKFEKNEELEYFFHKSVEKIIKYDQEYNTDYYKTAVMFCKCFGNINETAKQLSVHYNTVKYRINHILKVLNIDLENPDTRLEIYIGVKIAEYLRVVQKSFANTIA